MTEAKHDRFVFVGWSGLLLFPTAYLAIGGSLLALRLSQVGTLTDLQVVTLRVLISLQRLCQRLLMLWVILFFYFGVLKLKGTLSGGANLEGFWAFVALHGAFALIGFMLRQFELARLIGIRPYNAIAFSGPIAVFVSVFLIYPLGQSSWFFLPSFGVMRYSDFCCSSKAFTTGHSTLSI